MVFLMPLRFVSGPIETLKRLGAARWRPGFVNRVFKRANAQVAKTHDFAGAAETVPWQMVPEPLLRAWNSPRARTENATDVEPKMPPAHEPGSV